MYSFIEQTILFCKLAAPQGIVKSKMVTLPPIVIVFGGSIYFETRKILVDLNRVW